MNCQRIKRSGKPAGWLHSLCCAGCRASRRTDDLLAFGVVQLRKQSAAVTALNRTMGVLDLPPIAENWSLLRRRQRRTLIRRASAATVTFGILSWSAYMNWMPSDYLAPAKIQRTMGYEALLAADKAMTVKADKISSDVSTLELHKTFGPIPEEATVGRFVAANAQALGILHANLAQPYEEPLPRSVHDETYNTNIIHPLGVLLQAEAVWRASQGDRSGALDDALQMITFGANVSGHGSVLNRFLGIQSQRYGQLMIWRLLPSLSAEEAHQACRRVDAARGLHTPLQTTVQWEREAGLALRRDILASPVWRWRFAKEMGNYDTALPAGIGMAVKLYGFSNRRIMQDYLRLMDAQEKQWSQPYSPVPSQPLPEPADMVNQMLFPAFTEVPFIDAENETQNALLMTALALQAYRQEHGAYPQTLQALCPKYLNSVPTDPFHPGASLRYATVRIRTPFIDGAPPVHGMPGYPKYLLYSVGPDTLDQHGAPALSGTSSASSLKPEILWVRKESAGDIVAGINF
ncbi:MAG: hypothetical protein JWL77_608 [Chthonomonadaceae bacterium]|nr:hypothetical protein [Chthonomonadaceae bacterium]